MKIHTKSIIVSSFYTLIGILLLGTGANGVYAERDATGIDIGVASVPISYIPPETSVVYEHRNIFAPVGTFLTKNLSLGMIGDEVKKLQEYLGTLPDIYPEGLVTGYFGDLTKTAVQRLQAQFGIESVGVVGPKTRAVIENLAGVGYLTTKEQQGGVVDERVENSKKTVIEYSKLDKPKCPEFKKTLSLGAQGDDVSQLQEYLSSMSDVYPEGMVTGYFGSLTAEAVKRWQKKLGLESVGIVGPQTRMRCASLEQSSQTARDTIQAPVVTKTQSLSAGKHATSTLTVSLTEPASHGTYEIGSRVTIAWNAPTQGNHSYQVIIGNTKTKSEHTLYDRVSDVALLPAHQLSFPWIVPDLGITFVSGSDYTIDKIRDSFFLQVRMVSSAGVVVASSNKVPFSFGTPMFGLRCPAGEKKVTICHRTSAGSVGKTLTVSCHALEPRGHSTHQYDTLGACVDSDTTPPKISNITVSNLTQSTATVSWSTNESTKSTLWYVNNTQLHSDALSISSVTEGGTKHSVTLTSLHPETLYAYTVSVTDRAGNVATSSERRFLTRKSVDDRATTTSITATASVGGTIDPAGVVSVQKGTSKTFIVAPTSGYATQSLLVDGVNLGALPSYTFSAIQGPHTIHASFSATSPSYHSFRITSGPHGKITSHSTSVTRGGDMTFNIMPDEGYQVESFTIDGVSAGAPTTYTFTNVTADHAINATFAPIAVVTHQIEVLQPTNGTISPSSTSVRDGVDQMFTITPRNGYTVSKLLIDGQEVAGTPSYTFTNVTGAHTISAIMSQAVADLSSLTIRGRFVHAFTGMPVPKVAINMKSPTTNLLTKFMEADVNGAFSFSAPTDAVVSGKPKPYTYSIACYIQSQTDPLATIVRRSDGGLAIYSNMFDLIKRGSRYVDPVTQSDIDLGDVPLWPAKNITIQSDIPVKFNITYPEEASGVGNTLLKTTHTLSNAVPLDYDTTVKLTDENGVVYTSPVQRYGAEDNCVPAVLTFTNGTFVWQ